MGSLPPTTLSANNMKLNINEMIASAELISGVSGVIDQLLHQRFSAWIDGLNASDELSPQQAFNARQQIVRLLAQRLRIAGDRKRIPAIAEERIDRPIFVIGFGRTGTTLLHSLFAEDPVARAPQWWQTHKPSPPPGEMPVTQFRLDQASHEMHRMMAEVPGVLELHPYWDYRANALIEDEEIYTLDFCNSYPTLLYRVPVQYSSAVNPQVAAQAYRFHKQFLQHMQWNLPKRRWVVKGVRHQVNLAALLETYPDAICVWPHREISQNLPTFLGISALWSDAITGGRMDWKEFGANFVKTMRDNIDKVLTDPLLDDPRIMHVRFKDLTHDPVGMVKKVYSNFGLEYSGDFEQRMHAWLANNRSDRYGRHGASYEHFGLKAEEIKEMFADYSTRFDLG